jgi:hypothetical protein
MKPIGKKYAAGMVLILATFSLAMFSMNMVSLGSDRLFSLTPSSRHCIAVVGVFSRESDMMRRDIIRQTWGKPVLTPGAALFFVIKSPRVELSPHQAAQIERERALEQDLLFLDLSEKTETSYANSVAWLSWAANHTDCDYVFTTQDDTYVRLPLLMEYLSYKIGTSTDNYFGRLNSSGCPNQLSMLCVSSVGYGVSRNVAVWISTNKNLALGIHENDVAVAILLSHLRASSSLKNYTNDDAFGPECTANAILDSPALSQGFNMYNRFQDDQNGDFCASKHAIESPRQSEYGAFDSSQFPDSAFEFKVSTLHNPVILDEAPVPWDRSNRDGRYFGLRNNPLSLFTSSPMNRLPWLATTDTAAYGSRTVKQILDPHEAALRALAAQRSQEVFHGLLAGCNVIRVIGIWLKLWGDRREYVSNLLCSDYNGTAAVGQALVHVPFQADGTAASPSPALCVNASQRLVITAPATCLLAVLKRFLSTSGVELHRLPGKHPRRIVLAWSHCHDPVRNFTMQELAAAVAEFRHQAPSVEVVLCYFEDGQRFSRSRAINRALQECSDDDLVVVLDLDMVVRFDYYLNCLAFARRGHTMYFPIVFSRFSPTIISGYAKEFKFGLTAGESLANSETITEDTGQWRDFGMGMVAMYADDARTVGGYDAEIEGWGFEDVSFFNRAQASGYMTWRMHDPAAVHTYHSKDCRGLIGSSRHTSCLRSKHMHEGNQLQLSIALDVCQLNAAAASTSSKSAGKKRGRSKRKSRKS